MDNLGGKTDLRKPGCFTRAQIDRLKEVVLKSGEDPSLVSDLEGCGPIARLEEAFARVAGTRFALALSSGTAAIHSALLAAGVGYGDEVIVTPYSWPQSISPVLFTGAIPVFADIDPLTFNIDPESVSKLLSPKTHAIIPVHLFGHMADMDRLMDMAVDCGAALISDGAHALGAALNGKPVGAWGDAVCFSLGRGKLISSGEGGILATSNPKIYEKAVCLTQHEDRAKRIWPASHRPEIFSLNYRLHPLAAILAQADLDSIRDVLSNRQRVFDGFWEGLGRQQFLSPQASLEGERPAAYGIPLTAAINMNRENLVWAAQAKRIPLRCGPVSNPLHLRLGKAVGPRIPFHRTHLPGSCPKAEERCEKQELLVLSALDMDGLSPEAAYLMGKGIREELEAHPGNYLN
ncbi:MAG: DegT/DnrJ/EryC1/StrS family aminotransferase [Thermodesulfobacteriota bacterium]|nr:DegT/DnrJ/EryC1/StrS family aminotransferase [Thermodesulfobacteriota bacterium]